MSTRDDRDGGFDKPGRSRTIPCGKRKLRPATFSEQLAALHQVVLERERADRLYERDGGSVKNQLARTADRYGLLPGSIRVREAEKDPWGIGLGGYDRPLEEVWTVDDVIARYQESDSPEMYCGWCKTYDERHESFRSETLEKAIRWFRYGHACGSESAENPELPYDFTDEELTDNPHLRKPRSSSFFSDRAA